VIVRPSRRVACLERTLIRRIFDSAPADAINLGLGQPDLPTPPVLADAGVAGIAAGKTGYTSTAGDPALRQAIADDSAIARSRDDVLVTVGSQEAMFVTCLGLLDPGDEVLYPDPGYPAYPAVAGLIGARATPYPLRAENGFRLSAKDIAARIGERTRAVIVNEPSNPTGAFSTERELSEVAALLAGRGVCLISDEIYSGFAFDRPFVSLSQLAPEAGLVISGLSKDVSMTGWRIGWVSGPDALMQRLIAVHQYVVTCTSSVSQAAALEAFSPAGRRARSEYLEIFRTRRSLMHEELQRIPHVAVTSPDGAFYFFVDLSHYGESRATCERILRNQQVVVIPAEAFGTSAPGFVRISFAASDDAIREGVRRIAAELA
jgi:aspartate/methionine/tyrosine aminotransferase